MFSNSLHHHKSFNERVELIFESDEPIVYVVGDEDLIKQLLMNLVVNAMESFDGSPGKVTCRLVVHSLSNKVELYVEDNGPGIPKERLKKIYQPFFSTKKQGTGLGLSIVHRICVALKIRMDVVSQEDQGTTFMVEFRPYTQQKAQQTTDVTAGNDMSMITTHQYKGYTFSLFFLSHCLI